jgi:hypothetical protein
VRKQSPPQVTPVERGGLHSFLVRILHVLIIIGLLVGSTPPQPTHATTTRKSRSTQPASLPVKLASQHTIAITDNGFQPATLTIISGDSVTWSNQTQQTYGVQVDLQQQLHIYLPLIMRYGLRWITLPPTI